jgi:LytS/YehU family sensor histidine kinase
MTARFISVLALSVSILVTGCASPQAGGILGGAALGAAIGNVAGDSRKATGRGAAAGALLGLILSSAATAAPQQGVVNQGYYQQQGYTGQRTGGPGCVKARVDGIEACYQPAYLQTLNRNN